MELVEQPPAHPRRGGLDTVSLRILIAIFRTMEDEWYDLYEELIDHTNLPIDSEDEAEAERAMNQYDLQMEQIQRKVMRRVGLGLNNWAQQLPDRLAIEAFLEAQKP